MLVPRGLQCYDPSQEPAYTQPGTRGHAGGKASESPHKATRQETEVPSDCLLTGCQSLCELHSKQPRGLLGPHARGGRKAAASRSGGLQAPLSATHEPKVMLLVAGPQRKHCFQPVHWPHHDLAQRHLSRGRPGERPFLMMSLTPCRGCAFSRIYGGREGQ